MSGVREYGLDGRVAAQAARVLAAAAALDYVLMLATDNAGTFIPADDVQRAIREGFARAIDEALPLLRAIAEVDHAAAHEFARAGLRTLRTAIDAEALADDARTFAMIALASDLRA